MPILDTFADPRLQLLIDFSNRERQRQLQREAERAQERTFDLAGFAGGGLVRAFPTREEKSEQGGFGRFASAALANASLVAGSMIGGAGGGGTLGSRLLGAQIGADASQSVLSGDIAGGIQTGLQGAATIANLPALQAQGISALDVAMVGSEGLPNLLRQAQIGNRQRDNIMQRDLQRRMAQNKAVDAMPPGAKAQWATNEQRILDWRMKLARGEATPDEFVQGIEPFTAAQQVLLDANQPVPPPTMAQRFESGQLGHFDESTQTWFTSKDINAKQIKTIDSADMQAQISDRAIELEDLEKQRRIGTVQQGLLSKGVDLEKALKEAKRQVENDAFFLAAIRGQARQAAEQEVGARKRGFRQAQAPPSPEEKKQQQEAAEQQQVQQQQATQQQQAQEARVFFARSAQALIRLAENRDSDPSEWSQEAIDEAMDPASGLLQSLAIVGSDMSPEQKEEIRALVELAIAIVEVSPRLGRGAGP